MLFQNWVTSFCKGQLKNHKFLLSLDKLHTSAWKPVLHFSRNVIFFAVLYLRTESRKTKNTVCICRKKVNEWSIGGWLNIENQFNLCNYNTCLIMSIRLVHSTAWPLFITNITLTNWFIACWLYIFFFILHYFIII